MTRQRIRCSVWPRHAIDLVAGTVVGLCGAVLFFLLPAATLAFLVSLFGREGLAGLAFDAACLVLMGVLALVLISVEVFRIEASDAGLHFVRLLGRPREIPWRDLDLVSTVSRRELVLMGWPSPPWQPRVLVGLGPSGHVRLEYRGGVRYFAPRDVEAFLELSERHGVRTSRVPAVVTVSPAVRWTAAAVLALGLAAGVLAYNGTRVTPLVVSRETTFITEPLLPDGTPDYVGLLNARRGRGVTDDNNAAPALRSVKLVGTTLDSAPFAEALRGHFEPWPAGFGEAFEEQVVRRSGRAPWRASDAPLAAAWLQVNDAELRRVDEVVATRSRWWNPLPAEYGFNTGGPSLLPIREVANAYRRRTMAAIGGDDEEGAVATTAAALRFAGMFGEGGSLLERLIGIAAHTIAFESVVVVSNPPPRRLATAQQLLTAMRALPASPPIDEMFEVDERLATLARWSDLYRAARRCPVDFQQRVATVAGAYEQLYSHQSADASANLRRIPAAAVDWNELFRVLNGCWNTDACEPELAAAREDLRPLRFVTLRIRALLLPDARRRLARALLLLDPPFGSWTHLSWNEQEAEARLALVSAAAAVARLADGRYPAGPERLRELAGLDPRSAYAGYGFEFAASPDGRTFGYTASPIRPGSTGRRWFCADSTGRVAHASKETILLQDGLCSPGLMTLAARTP